MSFHENREEILMKSITKGLILIPKNKNLNGLLRVTLSVKITVENAK